jgi:hypothetical protein
MRRRLPRESKRYFRVAFLWSANAGLRSRTKFRVLARRRWLCVGKVSRGFEGGGVDFYEAVDFGHFEEAGDHFGDTGQVKGSAGGLQAGEAIYDSSEAGAVDFCGFREIEDDAGLFFAQKVIHGLSKAHTFDP